jgi:uncharacterized membrane protein YgcG
LQGYLDGTETPPPAELEAKDGEKVKKVPNPDHATWKAMEQQVLGFLMTSLSWEVMAQVATLETPQEVYGELVQMYASASRARTVNMRIALATTRKGNMSVTEYVAKIKFLADDMASAGKKVDDEELVSYLLAGLDEKFNPVVTAVGARTESISVGELVSQLLSFEHRLDLLHGGSQGSANMAKCGRGGSNNHGRGNQQGRGGGRGRSGGRGRGLATPGGRGTGRGYFNNSSYSDDKPQCQICDKIGHTALECWYRLDEESYPNQRSASAATHSYGVDTNWYTDTGSTDHITGELEKLSMKEKYKGKDQIRAANGAGMNISHIGHAIISTPNSNLKLNRVLHVPAADKNLISVHRLTSDNHAYLEFYPNHFLV